MLYSGLRRPYTVLLWARHRMRLAGNRFHKSEAVELAAGVTSSAAFVKRVMGEPPTASDRQNAIATYRSIAVQVNRVYGVAPGGVRLPSIVSESDGISLYSIVRQLRPRVVVETGISDGASSSMILHALEANAAGTLHSIDLPAVGMPALFNQPAGWVVPKSLTSRWRTYFGSSDVVLPRIVANLGPVDLFFHDSEHTYWTMSREFGAVLPHMRPGGVVASDDALSNDAVANAAAHAGLGLADIVVSGDGLAAFRMPVHG
jgi:predicted O-methyltransferase YrrM